MPTLAPTAATEPVDCGDVEEFTPAQREVMKKEVLHNLESLQDLLKTYQEQQETLQEEVAGFVLRDVEEQNEMHAIALEVESHQQAALQNPEYLRWAAAAGKGEFRRRNDSNGVSKSAPGDNVNTDDDDDDPSWLWYESLPANSGDGASLASILPLDSYPGVKQYLAGWRRINSSISQQLDLLAEDLFQGALDSNGVDDETTAQFVVLINGLPVYDPCLFREDVAKAAVEERVASPWDSPEAAASWWQTRLLTSSSIASAASIKELLCQSPSTAAALLEGTADLVSLVRLCDVQHAVVARLVSIDGVVKAVEVCDPMCDVLGLGPDGDAVLLQAAGDVASTLRGKGSKQQMITTLVARPSGPTDTAGSMMMITDARQLSPSIPFRWRLTWPEVCGLGKVHGNASVVVKRTRAKLATLEGFDPLSTLWFEPINALLTTPPPVGLPDPTMSAVPTPATQRRALEAAKDDRGTHHNAQLALMALATATVSVAATLWLSVRLRK